MQFQYQSKTDPVLPPAPPPPAPTGVAAWAYQFFQPPRRPFYGAMGLDGSAQPINFTVPAPPPYTFFGGDDAAGFRAPAASRLSALLAATGTAAPLSVTPPALTFFAGDDAAWMYAGIWGRRAFAAQPAGLVMAPRALFHFVAVQDGSNMPRARVNRQHMVVMASGQSRMPGRSHGPLVPVTGAVGPTGGVRVAAPDQSVVAV